MIPISSPIIGEPEEQLVLEVLRSGRLVQGPMVERFESEVARVTGTRHAVAVNNGTSALIAALLALGIGPGDEVVTSPFTFVATLNAILYVGAKPRFVDIGDDFNLDPEALHEAIGESTRVIMPVHVYGQMTDMPRVEEIARAAEVAVVEDAAQALGAKVGERSAGSFGVGCFSFYATKNLTTGEGGMVTTDDASIEQVLRVLRNQGQRGRYDYERLGFNLRMTELEAAIGVAQMTRFRDIVAVRRNNAAQLSARLEGIDGLLTPTERPGRHHVFHQYTIRLTAAARLDRDELAARLEEHGIGSGVYYPRPVYDYECFRADPRVDPVEMPNAARISREVLSLPVHPGVREPEIIRITDAVREALA